MESKSTSGVLRRKAPSFRHYPYATGSDSRKEDMKEEVVRLGVSLSVSVAETMFLLCDDIRTLMSFCFKLWRNALPYPNPVLIRLFRVIYYVYLKDIKPKNGVYQSSSGRKSAQWNLIKTAWSDFVCGIIVLDRLVSVLRRNDSSFDDRLLSSAIAKYKQLVKNLDDKLRSAKDVSEANGFVKETIESNVFYVWNSLFDDEEFCKETPEVLKNRIFRDMFNQLLATSCDGDISALPICDPYILGKDFAREELKKETVRLGVELSLYVAQWMFLLCDDIRCMLWLCLKLWRDVKRNLNPNSPVAERLLLVIHHVYLRGIKPKNGVYKNDGLSVHLSLAVPTCRDLVYGFENLHLLVSKLLKEGSCLNIGRLMTSSIEQVVKKVEETLSCSKDVSEANGFVREDIEWRILGFWKSLFDKEAKEATQTMKVIKYGIIYDLFLPLLNEVAPP